MPGTFSSITGALSALRYNRVVMDTASGNIANVATEGYTRRRVEAEATGAPIVPALWSRFDGSGDGVKVDQVARLSDALIQNRVRQEHSTQSYLDARQASLARFESGIGEPGDNGVAQLLTQFRASWRDLENQPNSQAAREQVIKRSQSLTNAINLQANNVTKESANQAALLGTDVNTVNTMVKDLAATNKAIVAGKLNDTDINNLLDTRDLLATKLAELTGATAKELENGSIEVKLGGVMLVGANNFGELKVATGLDANGALDGNAISFTVKAADTGTVTPVTGVGGRMGGTTELLNVTYPKYLTDIGAVAKELADQVNTQHQAGFDQSGAAGVAFFSYSAANPAGTISVAITDYKLVAGSAIAGGNTDTGNAHKLAEQSGVEGSYQRLVSALGNTVSSADRLATNQKTVTKQVDAAREQQAGINFDEEMVSLMNAQRGYEAASRVMNIFDSMLDTLINRTGRG